MGINLNIIRTQINVPEIEEAGFSLKKFYESCRHLLKSFVKKENGQINKGISNNYVVKKFKANSVFEREILNEIPYIL